MSDAIAPVLEGARSILESWPESKSLKSAIYHLERAMLDNSDAAIDAAKCLVEALCKTILIERGVKPDPNPKIQPLLKQTCSALGLSETEGGDCVRNMVSGMATSIQALGEFRNQFGPLGHGRDAYHNDAEDWQRTIAVRTAEAICVLIHESYRRLPTLDRHSRRPYRDDLPIHEVMDHLAVVTIDEETREISINGVSVRPSQILWDQDRIAYIEQKRAAEGISPSLDELLEVAPAEWPGRRLIQHEKVGEWADWLDVFRAQLEDVIVDPAAEVDSLAKEMAKEYEWQIEQSGDALASDGEVDRQIALQELVNEFAAYLKNWRNAWQAKNDRK